MNTEQELERPLFATLQYAVLRKLEIKPAEYMLLDMVYHLSAKHGYCYKTTYSIAHDMGLTFNAVKAMINRLLDRGLLIRSAAGLMCGDSYKDVAYIQTRSAKTALVVQKLQHSAKTALPKRRKKLTGVSSAKTSQNSAKTSDKNNTRIRLHKYNTTNVVLATDKPDRYGKPEINDLFDYWEKTVGYRISSKIRANRFAASTLLKVHGVDKVKQLVRGVQMANDDQYAPRIADFSELQQRVNQLVAWGNRTINHKQAKKGIIL